MSDFELQRRVDLLERMVKDILRQLFISESSGSTGNAVIGQIASNASGGGKYNLKLASGESSMTGSGDLSMPEGLTVESSPSAIFANMLESSTHELSVGQWVIGVEMGDGLVFGWAFAYLC
jgi:hypothetical protein